MPDLKDGESVEVKGSGSAKYQMKNTGGVYACTCPAWRNQSVGIERRTCKHLRAFRGEAAERERLGGALSPPPKSASTPQKDVPPLLLAERYAAHIDVTGWWMSEKLDGVRAYWDGKRFVSRLGNPFFVPEWFLEKLPPFPLDGELFGGRKKFQRTVSIVRRQDKNDLWKEISFLVFDAPAFRGAFEERLGHYEEYIKTHEPPYASGHPHQLCKGEVHLKEELSRVEALGGEGLMLRQPGSPYVEGRSSTLLKVKNFFDAEARVLGHVAGKGRHKGRVGALLVEMPNGTRFEVGTGLSDAERESPPGVGSVITYRYQELSDGGVPRFPSYLGVRDDVAFSGREENDDASKPVAGEDAPPSQAASAKEPKVGPSRKRAAPKSTPTTPTEATAPTAVLAAPAPPPRSFPPGTTHLRYDDGKSQKFWEIALEGTQHTVRYGRLGAAGQAKTKNFPSEDAAKKDAEALIASKKKKGYS